MSPDIFFGEGDVGPPVQDVIIGQDGKPVDLTGATLVFRYRDKDQLTAEVDEPATLEQTSDPTTMGAISWTPAGPMPPGEFNANWVISFGGSAPVTFPNDRYLWMSVQPKP